MTTWEQDRVVLANKMKGYPWANFEEFQKGVQKAHDEWMVEETKIRRELGL